MASGYRFISVPTETSETGGEGMPERTVYLRTYGDLAFTSPHDAVLYGLSPYLRRPLRDAVAGMTIGRFISVPTETSNKT
ncbi:conserved hypothetical protein [Xenorhabdus nematophila str. Websteri]|nr:conserved hypothetical protein [Xenorhabdus nematophila str. Websteri]CEF32987.1 conserved hypothetical protein [Xenorhabdus nematophila str. Websteri]